MRKETETHLIALNQRFYDTFADAFSASRGASEPGFDRLVARIEPASRILDLGCGHARLARLLPSSCTYVGVDSSQAMLRIASARVDAANAITNTTLIDSDLVRDKWEALVGEPFDWIILRAVLHHVPGYLNRLDIVRRAAHVRAAGGRIIVANWQFLKVARLRRRILPWSTVGLTGDDVDPGDYLLDWTREGSGARYAHLIDETETEQLAADAGLHIVERFYADGHTNDLTLYAVLE